MRSFAALGLFALAGLATAQDQYTIDPETVNQATREYWCKQQKSQCPLICLQQPGVQTQNTVSNECEWENLSYSCVCEDGSSPNITKYTQTMPYFVCTEWGTQCVNACGNDASCADACRADHPCGAQDPPKPNATASTSSSSGNPTASPTSPEEAAATNTGLLGESDDNNPNGTGGAMALGASFGTLALSFAGVVAFAFL